MLRFSAGVDVFTVYLRLVHFPICMLYFSEKDTKNMNFSAFFQTEWNSMILWLSSVKYYDREKSEQEILKHDPRPFLPASCDP